mmetsp:Transcript_11670/g.16537  ORF Transcript_11670/g.16537 Transcript_11670/m.16537 type:complete len:270 (-) Transcript_11670:1166-1975(-)
MQTKFENVTLRLDKQQKWIESLCEHHQKFSTKFNDTLAKVDNIMQEVNAAQTSGKTNYSRLNKIFDMVEDLKEDADLHKSEHINHVKDTNEISNTVTECHETVQRVKHNLLAHEYKIDQKSKSHQNIKEQLNILTRQLTKANDKHEILVQLTFILESRVMKNDEGHKKTIEQIISKLQHISTDVESDIQKLHQEIHKTKKNSSENTPQKPTAIPKFNDPSALNEEKPLEDIQSTPAPMVTNVSTGTAVIPIDLTTFLESGSQTKPSFPK